MNQLKKLNGAVVDRFDYFDPSNLLRSTSPGVNWLFGRTHGLPYGMTVLLWGEKKSGKTLLSLDWAGQVHKSDPEAIVVKFDTEYRDKAQLTPEMAANFGIDFDRFQVIESNKSEDIFDQIQHKIDAMCKDGAKVKLIIIDSLSGIQGRREAEQESVLQHQIGDQAMTLQIGLRKLLPVQRENKIAVVLCAHARAEMDPIEVKRGNKTKPAAANAVAHHCEFFINIARVNNKSGKVDELERSFIDDSKKGMDGEGEQTGHKICVWMQDNTLGPKNRLAEFTLEYKRGIVNTHEEVFRLGLAWGVIGRPAKGQYVVGDQKFIGKPNFLAALEASKEMQAQIISGLLEREKSGTFINVTSTDEGDLDD
jgi:RecA/RadA recombinase